MSGFLPPWTSSLLGHKCNYSPDCAAKTAVFVSALPLFPFPHRPPPLPSLLIFYARGVRTRDSCCFNEVNIFSCVCVPYILKIHFSCRCRRENGLALLFKIWNTAALCYCGFHFSFLADGLRSFCSCPPYRKKKGWILFCCKLVFNLAAQANLLHGHSHDQLIAVCAIVSLGSKIG